LFMNYYRQHGVQTKIVRIFNTYGPKMHPNDGRVVSNFIVQALKGNDITIYGDGSQTRSFCYVDDLVNGLIAMMATEGSVTGPINLGNPAELSVGELASSIIKLSGSDSKITFKPIPEDDPRRRKPDISQASNLLGWEPNIELTSGLKKTIAYFESL